ncbi:hypothetical protein AAFP30_24280 [Gordonia sp. CPCC 205515]|uniref:hypothetical protein n=1 Tax=Gordonia sp. CPCC 205515 TaxID=3140791 RepID=UPI003AF3BF79
MGPSTAPDYHDEYRIVVEHGNATLAIGGYGTVDGSTPPRHTETKPVDAEQWSALTSRIDALPSGKNVASHGCTGGSTYGVTVNDDGDIVKDTQAYACGADADAVSAPFTQFIEPIESLFDMQALLNG